MKVVLKPGGTLSDGRKKSGVPGGHRGDGQPVKTDTLSILRDWLATQQQDQLMQRVLSKFKPLAAHMEWLVFNV